MDAPITDSDNWPRCIQIAWQLHDHENSSSIKIICQADGFNIPYDERIHGISTELRMLKESPYCRFRKI
jgi:DNA polymerase-3 subunit alpha